MDTTWAGKDPTQVALSREGAILGPTPRLRLPFSSLCKVLVATCMADLQSILMSPSSMLVPHIESIGSRGHSRVGIAAGHTRRNDALQATSHGCANPPFSRAFWKRMVVQLAAVALKGLSSGRPVSFCDFTLLRTCKARSHQ